MQRVRSSRRPPLRLVRYVTPVAGIAVLAPLVASPHDAMAENALESPDALPVECKHLQPSIPTQLEFPPPNDLLHFTYEFRESAEDVWDPGVQSEIRAALDGYYADAPFDNSQARIPTFTEGPPLHTPARNHFVIQMVDDSQMGGASMRAACDQEDPENLMAVHVSRSLAETGVKVYDPEDENCYGEDIVSYKTQSAPNSGLLIAHEVGHLMRLTHARAQFADPEFLVGLTSVLRGPAMATYVSEDYTIDRTTAWNDDKAQLVNQWFNPWWDYRRASANPDFTMGRQHWKFNNAGTGGSWSWTDDGDDGHVRIDPVGGDDRLVQRTIVSNYDAGTVGVETPYARPGLDVSAWGLMRNTAPGASVGFYAETYRAPIAWTGYDHEYHLRKGVFLERCDPLHPNVEASSYVTENQSLWGDYGETQTELEVLQVGPNVEIDSQYVTSTQTSWIPFGVGDDDVNDLPNNRDSWLLTYSLRGFTGPIEFGDAYAAVDVYEPPA